MIADADAPAFTHLNEGLLPEEQRQRKAEVAWLHRSETSTKGCSRRSSDLM